MSRPTRSGGSSTRCSRRTGHTWNYSTLAARRSTPPRGPSSTRTVVGVRDPTHCNHPPLRCRRRRQQQRTPIPFTSRATIVANATATAAAASPRHPRLAPPPPPRVTPPCADLDAVIIVYDVADAASQTTYATAHPEEPWLNELQSHFSWAVDTFRRDSADLEGGAGFGGGGGNYGSDLGSLRGGPSVASSPSTPPLGPGSGTREGIAFA